MRVPRRSNARSQRDEQHEWREQVWAWVERTCAEQGVPVKVTDRRVVRQVADILRAAKNEREEEEARKRKRAL